MTSWNVCHAQSKDSILKNVLRLAQPPPETMCYDFCQLEATIECSQVTRDGYEATNLVSASSQLRQRGMLCESFVKPPVELVINLKCPIQLHHVFLYTKVGAQQSCGFELYSRTNANTDFCFLGKAYVNDISNTDRVYLINRAFIPLGVSQCVCVLPDNDSTMCTRSIGHSVARALTYVDQIKLRIVRTCSGASIPALGRIEIWGQPSRRIPAHVRLEIDKLIKKNVFVKPVAKVQKLGPSKDAKVETSRRMAANDGNVPCEFVDAITNEIMTTPVMLPSGNSIDKITLEKYCTNEATWGRPANDPFTNLHFTEERKVVPNMSLKARIDAYLLKNPEAGKNVGRSVGKSLRYRANESMCAAAASSNSATYSVPVASSILHSSSRCRLDSENGNVPKKLKTEPYIPRNESSNHEQNIKDSLNSSLQNVLRTMTSYTKKQTAEVLNERTCAVCSDRAVEYQLPCCHKLCRACLMNVLSEPVNKCRECRLEFRKQDPVKIHV